MEHTDKRVLVVEDDRFLRRACEATLRRRGLTVARRRFQCSRAGRHDGPGTLSVILANWRDYA